MSKRRIPLSALVIGSVSPDLPYYAFLTPVYAPGHTAAGILTNCLPQSFALFLIWSLWIRRPMVQLAGIASTSPLRWSLPFVFLVLAGIVLGAATHNAWDSTSHYNGWLVERMPSLRSTLLGLPLFKYIQYGGSVLGLSAFTYWIKRALIAPEWRIRNSSNYRIAAFVFLPTVALFVLATYWLHGMENIAAVIVNGSVAVLTGIFVASGIYATVDRLILNRSAATLP